MAGDNTIIINTLEFERIRPGVRFAPVIAAEPKRPNRFMVEFPHDFNIPSYVIQKITRPKLRFIENDYHWDNIELELIDLIGPSTTAGLMTMVEFCKNWDIARTNNQPLFSFLLTDLDPTGLNVGVWIIDVKELVLVDFGDNDEIENAIKDYQEDKNVDELRTKITTSLISWLTSNKETVNQKAVKQTVDKIVEVITKINS